MTPFYLFMAFPVEAVGLGLLVFAARWKRRMQEKHQQRALFGLRFIGGCWVLMGVVLFIYGLLGVQ